MDPKTIQTTDSHRGSLQFLDVLSTLSFHKGGKHLFPRGSAQFTNCRTFAPSGH
ncbi:MAG: hypothetical protein MJZ25_06645 [Fibrobacter sp.]|nr:hypothetical protein [Fibrobacter sp.]